MRFLFSLLALLIGISLCQNSSHFRSDDASRIVVKTFLADLKKASDPLIIGDFFHENFKFRGCDGDVDKEKVTSILSTLPNSFKTHVSSSKFIDNDIEFHVSMSGFGETPITAKFLLFSGKKKYSLLEGRAIGCSAPSRSFSHSDAQELIVDAFLISLSKAMLRNDKKAVSDLLLDDLKAYGCKAKYDKEMLAELLSSLPKNARFSTQPLRAEYVNNTTDILSDIYATTSYHSFPPRFLIKILLREKDGRHGLLRANIPFCLGRTAGSRSEQRRAFSSVSLIL